MNWSELPRLRANTSHIFSVGLSTLLWISGSNRDALMTWFAFKLKTIPRSDIRIKVSYGFEHAATVAYFLYGLGIITMTIPRVFKRCIPSQIALCVIHLVWIWVMTRLRSDGSGADEGFKHQTMYVSSKYLTLYIKRNPCVALLVNGYRKRACRAGSTWSAAITTLSLNAPNMTIDTDEVT